MYIVVGASKFYGTKTPRGMDNKEGHGKVRRSCENMFQVLSTCYVVGHKNVAFPMPGDVLGDPRTQRVNGTVSVVENLQRTAWHVPVVRREG